MLMGISKVVPVFCSPILFVFILRVICAATGLFTVAEAHRKVALHQIDKVEAGFILEVFKRALRVVFNVPDVCGEFWQEL